MKAERPSEPASAAEGPARPAPASAWSRAFAPATVANVAVGFDLLGFAFGALGDRVRVRRIEGAGRLELREPRGVTPTPADPERNTATVALRSLMTAHPLDHGLEVEIEKGIPMASGLGGSAASAVAAVVAAAPFWPRELARSELCRHALVGEAAVSGGVHPDNVVPALHGGFTASLPGDPVDVVSLPAPRGVGCVVVRPQLELETRAGRSRLAAQLELPLHVRQSGWLAGVIHACHVSDLELLSRCLRDDLIEPQRAASVPGFEAVRDAAREAGALGASLSGSGPSVFAWVREPDAAAVAAAMAAAFERVGLESQSWTGAIGGPGARVEGDEP